MTILKAITTIFVLFAISRAYLRFKDRTLSIFSFVLWILIWSLALVFVFDPNLSNLIAKAGGLGRGADAMFLLSIILLFYLIFRLYTKIDSIDKNLTTLVIELSKEKHKINHKE